MIETDLWPFIAAKNFKDVPPGRSVRIVVLHTMEAPENALTAENVAKWFATQPANEGPSSAHVCIDSDSVIQCVKDSDIAFAAPGANHDGIQIEMSGYARQNVKEWFDPYSIKLLSLAANVAAQYCVKYNIPVRQLTNAQLADGVSKGIVTHAQVTAVFKQSTHTDPGPNFPMRFFLDMATLYAKVRAL